MTTGPPHEHTETESAPSAAEVISYSCIVIGSVAICCSVSLNAMFYANLGRTSHEAIVFGAVAAVADVGKGILPVALARSKQALSLARRTSGWCAFLIFALASFVATLGFFAVNRTSSMGEQVARGAIYRSAQQELSDREAERRAITEMRSVAELDIAIVQALSAVVVTRGRSRTAGEISVACTKIDADTRDTCNRVVDLRGKRATAERRATLETRIGALRTTLGETSGAAGFSGGDPQARRLSDLTGLSVERVDLLLGILFALVVELSSGLLLAIGMSGLEVQRRQLGVAKVAVNLPDAEPNDMVVRLHAGGATDANADVTGALEAYVTARLQDHARATTPASDILHDALAWLREHRPTCAPLTASRLGRFLKNNRRLKPDKRDGRIVYHGIRIRTATPSHGNGAAPQ